jgi:hypothetical protein
MLNTFQFQLINADTLELELSADPSVAVNWGDGDFLDASDPDTVYIRQIDQCEGAWDARFGSPTILPDRSGYGNASNSIDPGIVWDGEKYVGDGVNSISVPDADELNMGTDDWSLVVKAKFHGVSGNYNYVTKSTSDLSQWSIIEQNGTSATARLYDSGTGYVASYPSGIGGTVATFSALFARDSLLKFYKDASLLASVDISAVDGSDISNSYPLQLLFSSDDVAHSELYSTFIFRKKLSETEEVPDLSNPDYYPYATPGLAHLVNIILARDDAIYAHILGRQEYQLKYRVTRAKHDLKDYVMLNVTVPYANGMEVDFSDIRFYTAGGDKCAHALSVVVERDYAVCALKIPYMPSHGGYIYCRWGDPSAPGGHAPLDVFEEDVNYVLMICDEYFGDESSIVDIANLSNFATVDTTRVKRIQDGYLSLFSSDGIVMPNISRYAIQTGWHFTLVAILTTSEDASMNRYLFKRGDGPDTYYLGIVNTTGHAMGYIMIGGTRYRVESSESLADGKRHVCALEYNDSNATLKLYVDGTVVDELDMTGIDVGIENDDATILLSGSNIFHQAYLFKQPVLHFMDLIGAKYLGMAISAEDINRTHAYTYSYRDPWKPKLELEEEMQTRFLFGDGVMPAGADWERQVWDISISSPTFAANKVVIVGMESGGTAPTEPMTVTVWGGISETRITLLEVVTGPTEANQKIGKTVELNRAIKYVKVTAHGASDQDTPAFAEGAIA